MPPKNMEPQIKNPYDLEPEEEAPDWTATLKKSTAPISCLSPIIHPRSVHSMRWMTRTDPKVTLSFDLLFRGLEITTGGQRIHSYTELDGED